MKEILIGDVVDNTTSYDRLYNYSTIKEAVEDFQKNILNYPSYNISSAIGYMLKTNFSVAQLKGMTNIKMMDLLVGYEKEGKKYPFVLGVDNFKDNSFCMIPVLVELFNIQETYKQLYKDGPIIDEDVYYPLVVKDEFVDFNGWLKSCKLQLNSHLYGQKSKSVKWQTLSPDSLELYKVFDDTVDANIAHNQFFWDRFGTHNLEAHAIGNVFDVRSMLHHGTGVVVAAKDLEEDKYVAFMINSICEDSMSCGTIVASKEEKYKPYSLVAVAQAYSVQIGFESSFINNIDLGFNIDACAEYKDSLTHSKKHLVCFPSVCIG